MPARHHDGAGRQIPDQDVPHQLPLRLYRDARFRAPLPDARVDPAARYPAAVAMEAAMLAPEAEGNMFQWNEPIDNGEETS